jgi:hypothetical protein
MALVLEGGYDLASLESGVRASVSAMLGAAAPEVRGDADNADVSRAAARARATWKGVS